jgi:hypothetical protein
LLYLLCAQVVTASRGDAVSMSIIWYFKQPGVIVPMLFAIWAMGQFFVMVRVEKLASSFRDRLATLLLDGRRWSNAIPFLIVILLMSTAFN